MTKSNDKKVPALRFKGFTDDWEQRKFNKIANKIGATSSAKIPNVSYDDILSKRGVLNKKISKLSTGKKGIKFKENDILFGKLRPYLKNYLLADFSGIAIGDFWVLRPLESPDFLFYLIQSQKFTYISNISSGSKMPRSDWKLVSSFHFDIPKINEQIGIGKVLKLLDKLISLQQRKLEQLKLLKRMISLSIYPNFNDRIPIKFNLNSTWNKKKLKNITNYKNGTTHEQHQLLKGKFELINLNSISKEGRLKSSGKYINQQFPTLRKNDIVMILSDIAHGQLIGTSAVIPTNNKYILNQRVASLSPNENLNAVFISKYINLKQRYFKKMAAGMSQINLSKKDVEDFKLWVPNFKEQTKIANLLINFDLIEKNKNKKISYLLNLKKFLLQSLFL